MLRLQRQSNGQSISLGPASLLHSGGEGHIYALSRDRALVAKVYHRPTSLHANKLAAMVSNPPDDPTAEQGHSSIAWPVDLLLTADNRRQIIGFLMPRVRGMCSVIVLYNPGTRRRASPLLNYLYLHRAGRNLAAVVNALHTRDYVIGDLNESNIFVTDTALMTVVDTDSFQIRDSKTGTVWRCTVGRPEFTPPELQGKRFSDFDRAAEHDLFGLAVLIFQLLMEGNHPFKGIFQEKGEPPPLDARIAAGYFPYSRQWHGPWLPPKSAPPFQILDPLLQDLFFRCFEEGYKNPNARPSAQEWVTALDTAEHNLKICSLNTQHRYCKHLQTCPWCERTTTFHIDPFPSKQAVQSGAHTQLVQKPLAHPVARTQPAQKGMPTGPTLVQKRPAKGIPTNKVVCPICGHANDPNLIYCKTDWALLDPAQKACRSRKCGRLIPRMASFCRYCGISQ